MMFKRRVNAVFKDFPGYRTGDLVGIQSRHEEQVDENLKRWAGVVDRRIAKALPGARQVPLDFAAYRPEELSRTLWLSENEHVVGCVVEDWVVAVLDGSIPLIKKIGRPEKL